MGIPITCQLSLLIRRHRPFHKRPFPRWDWPVPVEETAGHQGIVTHGFGDEATHRPHNARCSDGLPPPSKAYDFNEPILGIHMVSTISTLHREGVLED